MRSLLLLAVLAASCVLQLHAARLPLAAKAPTNEKVFTCPAPGPAKTAWFTAQDKERAAVLKEVARKRAESDAKGIDWRNRGSRGAGGASDAGAAVADGTEAAEGAYPFMASLWHVNWEDEWGVQHFCGGTLINARTVLTAAHCVHNDRGKLFCPQRVRIGALDLYWDTSEEYAHVFETRYVKRVIAHKAYNDWTVANDVALLELDRPVDITLFPPISLAPASLPLSAGQRLVTMGWGATKWAWGSDALLYTEVPFVPRDVCRRKQGNFPISHVCAGGAPDGADSCSGDSGGPLIIDGATDVQVGIVSFGPSKCGKVGNIGYYTDVRYMRSWIDTAIAKYGLNAKKA